MLRVAGALLTHQVRAYDLLRMFGREGHPTLLGAAFTVRELRHRLARAIRHGGRGQIRQAYRESPCAAESCSPTEWCGTGEPAITPSPPAAGIRVSQW